MRRFGSWSKVFLGDSRRARIAAPKSPLTPAEALAPGGSSLKGMNFSGNSGSGRTMSGFRGKFMRLMEEPPGAKMSSSAVLIHGRTARNISERDRAESDRRETEARFCSLVAQLPAVTFMGTPEGGLSELYVSPQIERLLGLLQEEWPGDSFPWRNRLHPEDCP
jgi:PAS domain-containing protein